MADKQKKFLPAIFAAIVKYKMFLLCFVLIFVMAFSVFMPQMFVAASNRQTIRDTLNKVSEVIQAADPIYQELREIIVSEIESLDIEDDSEPDIDEGEEGYNELIGYIIQLDELISDIKGLSDDPNTSEGKTVRAAKEYLNMLRNMAADLSELVRYSIDLYIAIQAMDTMDGDTEDFAELAEQVWYATDATKSLLEEIKPPAYLAITHNDMIARVTEFRDFSEDFYFACYLEDPLRIYSCIYRMNRIIRMFTICGDNLDADMTLQFKQAERRLNGPIAQLNDELSRNLELLKNAQGGN